MRRILLASLLLLPGQALAGPPEPVSGRMVIDEVSDGLRRYRQESDSEKRIGWLKRLAPTKDPRVAVALWEAYKDPGNGGRETSATARRKVQFAAAWLLAGEFSEWDEVPLDDTGACRQARWFWYQFGDDLYRRAKELPR